ncbi:alpha-L-fucosidase [Dinghuibacter silviterrae]|uniref:alpha-L-fucosidase n=1 Tax=Dinghuibacter silviterrae TaxID=1539049 RepID=A0A4R8DSN0_9BACT|nr:alpha-L-fucosidase [Dinghuibacter silviterrae]TDX00868.1 alpha-L-fucosidase [Dinghuibacter silviterrae]
MKKCLILPLALLATGVFAQSNHVLIQPGDSKADIIRKAANVVPSPRQLRWQELELTAFAHFGMNTFTNREWGTGKEDPRTFNPDQLDARQWVRVLKEAGFKQLIITAKHHDGFCLWPSAYTEHSVKNSPYKGDVVKAVADACHEYGVGFGVYLSPWDRNNPDYGDSEKYNTYFMNQLTELLTHYGRVDEVWFDGANGEGPNGRKPVYDFNAWYALIRKLQPAAVIAIMGPDVRWVGTESGYGRTTEWSVIPADANMLKKIADNSQKDAAYAPAGDKTAEDLGSRDKILAAQGLVWYPAEADVSIRPGWFYHADQDSEVKSVDKLMDIYFSSVGRNCTLLMNIPPNTHGLISDSDVTRLRAWALARNAIFAHNLAAHAHVTASSGQHAAAVLDDKYETYYLSGDTTATLQFTLAKPTAFNVLLLQEEITVGQRIESFVLEYKDGDDWKEITRGTTVGYKRLLRFPSVTAGEVRLRILSSRTEPTLAAFGLYAAPGAE